LTSCRKRRGTKGISYDALCSGLLSTTDQNNISPLYTQYEQRARVTTEKTQPLTMFCTGDICLAVPLYKSSRNEPNYTDLCSADTKQIDMAISARILNTLFVLSPFLIFFFFF
jgi:hypothetical protein